MAKKTIYIGNLPYEATEDDLLRHFGSYGASNIRLDSDRGIAFLDVEEDRCEEAILEKHQSEMGGRRLNVNEARPKSPRPERDFRRRF